MTVHLLGTGAAVSDPDRTTTMLAIEAAGRYVLVDCGGDVVPRLVRSGLDPTAVEAVVLTHQHPDHISGFALLVERLWLLGRRDSLPVYGPADTLGVAERVFNAYATDRWDGLPERDWRPVALEPGAPVLETGGLRLRAWPVEHPVPTIGLRAEFDGQTLAYSCDTAACEAVVEMAAGADLLVHEATGSMPGVHASAEEAAETARSAGAERLVLVHLPPGVCEGDLESARQVFHRTAWGADGERIAVRGTPSMPAALAGWSV